MKMPLPENENARLKILHDYQILDTPAEDTFDDIALLASQICDAPIALISLVDENRQWFKSRIGLDIEETPRDVSFCAHAIASSSPDVFLVYDVLNDERFIENPLVVNEPQIRFYAGAPLVTPEKESLGTLCVIDRKPRQLTERQISALQALARQVSLQLELRRTSALLAQANEELKNLSLTDDLTGLFNRRGFMFHAEQQLKVTRSQQSRPHATAKGLLLIYADMDKLKQINDRFGHQEGSSAIKVIGQILKQTFRESDIIARLGGDEFTVLAINVDEKGDELIAARLSDNISEYNKQNSYPYELGLSVGIIKINPSDLTLIDELIKRADEAMYRNKRAKRTQSETL